MKKLFYILTVCLLPAFSNAQSNPSPQQVSVMMKMASLRSALLGKDSASLSQLLSDDCTYGHSNGMIQTKAQLIRDVMSGVQNYKSIDPTDMVVRIYDNSAVVTLKSRVNMIFQGSPLDMTMNVTMMWVKKKDWQIVARQSVKL
jgi:ketosteroid isomerase-like protein